MVHGPSCSTACGIFPDQGSNPHLLHWQTDSLPLSHQGSPDCFHFYNIFYLLSSSWPLHFGFFPLQIHGKTRLQLSSALWYFTEGWTLFTNFAYFLPFVLEYLCLDIIGLFKIIYLWMIFCFPRPDIYNNFLEKGHLAFPSSRVSEYKGPLLRVYTKLECLLKMYFLSLTLSSFLKTWPWRVACGI